MPDMPIIGVDYKPPTDILTEARNLIYGDRQKDYGPPTASFTRIAGLWAAYLDCEISATDVAHLMILLKVSRGLTGGYKRDTYVDIAGYAGCVERIEENK